MADIKPTIEYLRELRDDGRGPVILNWGIGFVKHFNIDETTSDLMLEALAVVLDEDFAAADTGIETVFVFRLESGIDTPSGRPNGEHHLNFCLGCDEDARHEPVATDLDDWRYEVANDDTRLGFEEWLAHREESLA